MPKDKLYNFLKFLYDKKSISRYDQDILKTRWYFDYIVMKLERAKIVTVSKNTINMTMIGRIWSERYFIIEDGEE